MQTRSRIAKDRRGGFGAARVAGIIIFSAVAVGLGWMNFSQDGPGQALPTDGMTVLRRLPSPLCTEPDARVDVTFDNPSVAGPWAYGYAFRGSPTGEGYQLTFDYRGRFRLLEVRADEDQQEPLMSGVARALSIAPSGSNQIALSVVGPTVHVAVNSVDLFTWHSVQRDGRGGVDIVGEVPPTFRQGGAEVAARVTTVGCWH